MRKTLRIYYLNHFLIYHTPVLSYSHHVVCYMPNAFLTFNWKFVHCNHLLQLLPF